MPPGTESESIKLSNGRNLCPSLAHYHKRSNAESTFSMIKRKFGDSLRGKTETAQVNETLAKVLCHNLVVLIHEMYALGVAPFWGRLEADAHEITC